MDHLQQGRVLAIIPTRRTVEKGMEMVRKRRFEDDLEWEIWQYPIQRGVKLEDDLCNGSKYGFEGLIERSLNLITLNQKDVVHPRGG